MMLKASLIFFPLPSLSACDSNLILQQSILDVLQNYGSTTPQYLPVYSAVVYITTNGERWTKTFHHLLEVRTLCSLRLVVLL